MSPSPAKIQWADGKTRNAEEMETALRRQYEFAIATEQFREEEIRSLKRIKECFITLLSGNASVSPSERERLTTLFKGA